MGGSIMKTLRNIPGFDQITKVLQKFGGEGSQGLLEKDRRKSSTYPWWFC